MAKTEVTEEKCDVFGLLFGLIGEDAMLKLVEKLGGSRLSIPLRATPETSVWRLLGEAAATAIVAELGGALITVPLAKSWRIKLFRERGMTVGSIAVLLGTTETTVYRTLRNMGISGRGLAAHGNAGSRASSTGCMPHDQPKAPRK